MFRQEFEIERSTYERAKRAFIKRYPECWDIWGDTIEYLKANNIESEVERSIGYAIHVYEGYICVVLLNECQKIVAPSDKGRKKKQ